VDYILHCKLVIHLTGIRLHGTTAQLMYNHHDQLGLHNGFDSKGIRLHGTTVEL
jgi:hypothetical protein